MNDLKEEYLSRKQITFDLSQDDLLKNYPRPKFTINPKFYKKAYKDISLFMKNNGFEHRQYSVYTSKEYLTTYDITKLMQKLAKKMPWLYSCVNEIDVTDIAEQYSIKEILGVFTNQKHISIKNEQKETSKKQMEKIDTMFDWKEQIKREKTENSIKRNDTIVKRQQKDQVEH